MASPMVSIITATYNSSHILKYAIESVLCSDLEDWELLIVGDHCTDDTETLVSSYQDPRIRFYNLPENSGQQAKPNNFGLQQARGEYLCYLNHDDMFLPWHLTSMLSTCRNCPESIILARYADIRPDDTKTAGNNLLYRNGGGASVRPEYNPERWYIASSWFMPMSIARQIGPWRLEDETFVTPSQDWLFRAWRAGVPLHCTLDISLLAVCTGGRKNFFTEKRDAEHEYLFARYISQQDQYEELCELVDQGMAEVERRFSRLRRRVYTATVVRVLGKLGVHPNSLEMLVRHGGRGGFIKAWRRGID